MRLKTMMLALAIVPVIAATVAFAQQPPSAPPQTLLQLSARGSVQAPPDQLVADLVAQSTSGSAADAQRLVNVQMSRGMEDAKSAAG